jgi:hypothetical protein
MVAKGQRAGYIQGLISPVPPGITMKVVEDEYGNVSVEMGQAGQLGAWRFSPSVWDEPEKIRAQARGELARMKWVATAPDVAGGDWWG